MRAIARTATEHTDEYLKAVSQALFFSNAFFGLGLLVLLAIFDRTVFFCGLLGSLIGYAYSVRYSTPKVLRDWGLITVNGLFFGTSVASLFYRSPALLVCLLLGALSIPLVTKATYEVLQHWKLSPFVFPYILSSWVLWLCARGVATGLRPQPWPEMIANLPHLSSPYLSGGLGARMAISSLMGMGRLLFLPNPLFGLSLLVLIVVFSPRKGVFFLLGTALATLAAYLISAGNPSWEYGYFSYSAGLVGLGLAAFPQKFAARTILLMCTISCFLTMATDQLLGSLHLPSLSLPYVLTLWLGALSRAPRLNVGWDTASRLYKSPVDSIMRAAQQNVASSKKSPQVDVEAEKVS